jgi:peptide/nickel transport system permease protein
MTIHALFSTLSQSLWVWLATDVLLWLLFVLFLFSVVVIVRSPLQRAVWQKVFRQRLAVVSTVLLAIAACFALLDSIHLREPLPRLTPEASVRYSVEVNSVLDLILTDLRKNHEKTYSAPLAVNLAALEPVTVSMPDGAVEVRREAPRLKVAGSIFPPGPVNDTTYWLDVLQRVSFGALGGALLFALLWLGCLMARRVLTSNPQSNRVAWRWVGLTLGVVFITGGVFTGLSTNFHVFGTDKVGQDVLYQVLKSLRTALVIGLVPTLVTLPLGIALGLSAGYFRGKVDDVIQYIYTTVSAVPGVLLIAASVLSIQVMIDNHPEWFATAVERGDIRLLALCIILGMTSWTGIARLLRGEALKMREYDYVQAARAFGVGAGQILLRHVLPNVFPIILITLVMEFSSLVLAEAVLSYIGIGVDPTMFSFGLMINNARMELSRDPVVWWSLTAAFLFMVILVLAANLLADAVRDALDPRSEGQS